MPKIDSLTCHKILDSRGNWTIETHVKLDDGSIGSHTVPEGASKGMNEAVYLPVSKAVSIVSGSMNETLKGFEAYDQKKLDTLLIEMDGTPNKSNLGANSILSISFGVAKAAAISKGLELWEYFSLLYSGQVKTKKHINFPIPVFNILNGGKHATNGLSFQEFMVIPAQGTPIETSLEIGTSIYHTLKQMLLEQDYSTGVGDEGGFAPEGFTPLKALSFIKKAASQKYKVGEQVFFGMDVAAESFYDGEKYVIPEEKLSLTNKELLDYHKTLVQNFEIIYLEDPFYEKDEVGWKMITEELGKKLMIVADDLVVTNEAILRKAIKKQLANAVIVKPNQIGTLSETFDFIKKAKESKMSVIVSHRSGDTGEDTSIADLSVAVDAEFLKSGAPVRGERVEKYNRLLDIYHG